MHQPNQSTPSPYVFGDLLIGGKWRPGGAGTEYADKDPFTGEILLKVPQSSVSDVEQAYAGAQSTQEQWAQSLPGERAEILRRVASIMDARHQEIVDWLIKESGSTRLKAELEWSAVRAIILEASTLPTRAWGRIIPGDIPGKEHYIYRIPVGVVSVISPWNWPLHLSSRAVGPALALGNTVVLKPASETIVTGGLLLAKMFEEAGLPPGVLSVVSGDNQVIGDPFVLHPTSRVISFTGSTSVGRRIGGLAATGRVLKKVQLELGGNNPLVVLDDADIDNAVTLAVLGRFLHQGQICVCANRLIVHDSIYETFLEAFVERVRHLKYGDPNDIQTIVGPVINERQLDKISKLIEQAEADGAKKRIGGKPEGLVIPPHVFSDVGNQMHLAREEIFGPLASVIRVANEDEALRVANDTDFGLSGAVLTRDTQRGLRFARQLQTGMAHVNDMPAVDLANMPFGGEKNSGLGRFGAHGVIEDFTTEHWVSVQHTPRHYPV